MAVELRLVEPVAVGVEGADLAGGRVAGEVLVAAAALDGRNHPQMTSELIDTKGDVVREFMWILECQMQSSENPDTFADVIYR